MALLAALALGGCSDQPAPSCITTIAPFAVKLVQRDQVSSAPTACDSFTVASFNADPEVGLSPYYVRDDKGQPDYSRGSLAVQTAEVGSLVYTAQGFDVGNSASGGQVYSLGDFTSSKPDDQNFCNVPTLSPTRVVLAAIAPIPDDPATEDADESFPGQAAVDVTLDWSNLRVYVTAEVFGTQVEADLADTRVTDTGDTCTTTYKALGIAPAVSCAALDADGAPIIDEDGTPQLDPSACDPVADPDNGRPLGSGLSPNARFSCDPATAFCLVEGETIPALH